MLALLDPGVKAALQLASHFADVKGVLNGVGMDGLLQHEGLLYRPDVSVGAEVPGIEGRCLPLGQEACSIRPLLPDGDLVLAVLQGSPDKALRPHDLVVKVGVLAHQQESVLLLLHVVALLAALA